MAGKPASDAKRRYNDKTYVHVHMQVKPEVKAAWLAAAEAAEQSLSSFIAEAVEQRIANDRYKK